MPILRAVETDATGWRGGGFVPQAFNRRHV